MILKDLISLVRVKQWYKNLVIFIPLIFSFHLTDLSSVGLTVCGFAVLCLVSSSSYIINDIVDRKHDLLHPEKKHRPIASGRISIPVAWGIALALLSTGIGASWTLSLRFFMVVIALFLATQAYSLYLKRFMVLDLLMISGNFILRTFAGAFLIDVTVSHWLVMLIFFFSLLLAIGKRLGDVHLKIKQSNRPMYTDEALKHLLLVDATSLLGVYMLYNFQHDIDMFSFLNAGVVTYGLFVYLCLVQSDRGSLRRPEALFLDKRIVSALVIWVLINIIKLYRTF